MNDESPKDRIRLVAMVGSGETYISLMGGRYWLHQPEGAGGAGEIAPDEVERAIARGDMYRVNQDFDDWFALEDRLQQLVSERMPQGEIDVDTLDSGDIAELLEVAEGWIATGEHALARRLACRLLELRPTRESDELNSRALNLVKNVAMPSRPLTYRPVYANPDSAARERFDALAVAA